MRSRGSAALVALTLVAVTGCSSATHGLPKVPVSGQLLAVGGPPGVPARPLSGTITLTSASGLRIVATTGSDGRFLMAVPAGVYSATGRSPQYDDGNASCLARHQVTVNQGFDSRIDVYCQEK